MKKHPELWNPRACQNCGAMWTPTTRYQGARNKTCSPACSAVLISVANSGPRAEPETTCSVCGKAFHRPPSHRKKTVDPTCSKRCNGKNRARQLVAFSGNGLGKKRPGTGLSGALNPAWKGGVTFFKTKGNYTGVRYVRAPEWARPMARADGYIMEHRLVMAAWCGRLLTRTEVVNHLDHTPANNSRTNLELWPTNADHKRGEFGRFVPGVANRLSLPD